MLVFDLLSLWYALWRCPFHATPWVLVLVWDFKGACVQGQKDPVAVIVLYLVVPKHPED